MPINSTDGVTNMQALAQKLVKRFDNNADGKLSADEFLGVLQGLIGGSTNLGTASPTTSGAVAISAPAQSAQCKFEGFNFERAQDPGKSAKDAFAMLATRNAPMPKTKSEAESWFSTKIQPEFEALGHKVNWCKGDSFQFTNWQGTYTVDFVRGADGNDPALAWQCVE